MAGTAKPMPSRDREFATFPRGSEPARDGVSPDAIDFSQENIRPTFDALNRFQGARLKTLGVTS